MAKYSFEEFKENSNEIRELFKDNEKNKIPSENEVELMKNKNKYTFKFKESIMEKTIEKKLKKHKIIKLEGYQLEGIKECTSKLDFSKSKVNQHSVYGFSPVHGEFWG